MTDLEFRIAMDWMMVSDPWPLSEREHTVMWDMLNGEAEKRGYDNWIVAYHEFAQ